MSSIDQSVYFFFSGAYVPLTKEDDIMVDGVLASCYPSVNNDFSQIAITPMKWIRDAVGWIFWKENGLQGLAIIAENVSKMINLKQQQHKTKI